MKSIKKGVEGSEEIIEKRELVDQEIADYFKQVYKRPVHMNAIAAEVSDDQEMQDEED